MAYDHWADYEKHFNAFLNAQRIFGTDFAMLEQRRQIFQAQRKSKDMIAAQKARTEYFNYLTAVENERRSAEGLARSSIGKLNTYIRNVKNFPESGQHLQNLNSAINALNAQRAVIARARSEAMGM